MIASLAMITLLFRVIAESSNFDKETISIVGSGLTGSLAEASMAG